MLTLSDINLNNIENIWTKDRNYIPCNDGLLLKNLYIKTDKYTIGFHVKEEDFFFYVKSGINSKDKRLSFLWDINRSISLYGNKNNTYVNLKILGWDKNTWALRSDTNCTEFIDISMMNLFLKGETEIPDINRGLLFITSSLNILSPKLFELFNVVIKKGNYIYDQSSTSSYRNTPISVNFKLNRKYKKKLGLIENSSQKS